MTPVYADAVPRKDLRPLLQEAVAEGDEIARVVVVDVLQHVDATEGRAWVHTLGASAGRPFAQRRLREWALIREVVARPRSIVDDLPDLSSWCRRLLVEHVTADVVLENLAEHGISRKVRHAARERRAGRWRAWERWNDGTAPDPHGERAGRTPSSVIRRGAGRPADQMS